MFLARTLVVADYFIRFLELVKFRRLISFGLKITLKPCFPILQVWQVISSFETNLLLDFQSFD